MPWGGRPQGAPLPIVFSRRYALGRAPTLCPGEGAHKGCPYQLSSLDVMPWGGRPQGVPLPIVFSKGRPYQLSSLDVMPWGGRPQGAPLPIVFSRRYALRRAPTRGAPTRFRQPHVGLSQFDAIALDGLQTELKLKPVTEIRTCLSASNSTRLSHGEGFPHISGADNQASRQRALFSFSLFRINLVRADLTALPPIHASAMRSIYQMQQPRHGARL